MPVLKYRDPATGQWAPLPGVEGPAGPAGAPGAAGPTGPMGAGAEEVHIANAAPTDAGIELWVDPDDPTGSATSNRFVPAGMIAPFAGRNLPQGWLLCNGSAVRKADFPALYKTIGALYDGDKVSPEKFCVPRLEFPGSVSTVRYIIKT